MSAQRLDRLTATFKKAIDAGDMPGVVIMVARDGKLVFQQAIGMQDPSARYARWPWIRSSASIP